MKLTVNGISNREAWKKAGITLPGYDVKETSRKAQEVPQWVHFGIGNIFRVFIGGIANGLLEAGVMDRGLTCVETFDYDVVDKIYKPFDNLGLSVILHGDGSREYNVLGSLAEAIKAQSSDPAQWARLKEIFTAPSLQMVSFTITEKGYALTNVKGEIMPVVTQDIENGPDKARHAMAVVAAMLYARFQAGAQPIAMVSMDNCSHNGEKLRSSVVTIVDGWVEKGHVPAAFAAYVKDESKVSFPWSMIDKITPRPADVIRDQLTDLGVEDMTPVITARNTYIAPFVNAEVPEYLVVEDRFPNGRPPLEKAGVYLTDRDTVNMTERMKVTTCLNPLHTALAVYGCLLGYTSIAAEMQDEQLVKLVKAIGYQEGLPVVTDPGIIDPRAFIDEVVEQRLPNPFIPDMPQRIATDTSLKVAIRFGETIKSYAADPEKDPASLNAIPLAIAGWLRYLLAVDDEGKEMPVSADPMLPALQAELAGIKLGKPESCRGKLNSILTNQVLFGADLKEVGLADKIEAYLAELLMGPGAVRATLKKHLG